MSSTGTVFYFIITLLITLNCYAEMDEFPRIDISEISSNSEEGLFDGNNRRSVSIFGKTDAEFQCVSDSPIYWNIKIPYLNDEQVSIENKVISLQQRFGDVASYHYITKVKIHGMAQNLIGNYICETIGNTSLSKSLFVFLSDERDPFYINAGRPLQIETMGSEHQLLIPCSVSRPSEKFYLLLQKGWKSVRVDADFIPHLGFVVNSENRDNFEGYYKCAFDGYEDDRERSIDVTVLSSNYILSPSTSLIYTKDVLLIKCSASYPIFLELEQNQKLKHHEILYETLPWNPFHYSVSLKHKVDSMDSDDGEGIVKCTRSNKSPIHQWKYKIVDGEHGLTHDRENAKVVCKSAIKDKAPNLSFRYCKIPELCKITERIPMDYNVQSGNNRNFEIRECGDGCLEVSFKIGGIQKYGGYTANCTIDGYTNMDTFILGLDQKLHNNIEVIPDDALILMRNDEVSTNSQMGHVKATCEWLSFNFAHSVIWKLILNNGSAVFINEGFSELSEINGVIKSHLDHQSGLSNIEELHCIVGFKNSSNWKIKSLKLNNFRKEQDYTNEEPTKADRVDIIEIRNNNDILDSKFRSDEHNLIPAYIVNSITEYGPEIKLVYWFVMVVVANMIAIHLMDSIRAIKVNDTRPISNGTEKHCENPKRDSDPGLDEVYSEDDEEELSTAVDDQKRK